MEWVSENEMRGECGGRGVENVVTLKLRKGGERDGKPWNEVPCAV
jgi:hypothetical protein